MSLNVQVFGRRRRLLKLAAATVALPNVPHLAHANAYPNRPVRLLVGFATGGGYDIAVQAPPPISPPDGYTLLMVGLPNASNVHLYTDLKFNFLRDIAPVGGIPREPFMVETNLALPVRTMREFISYAEARPEKINLASAGVGSGNHLAGALFQVMTGIKFTHVPYRGASLALADLLGGRVQIMFASTSSSIGYVTAGKLRTLAVTTAARLPALPDTPTLAESVPGYEFSFWNGVGVCSGTPVGIIETLNREINAALADPTFRARLAELCGTALPGSPAEFGKLITDETEKWARCSGMLRSRSPDMRLGVGRNCTRSALALFDR